MLSDPARTMRDMTVAVPLLALLLVFAAALGAAIAWLLATRAAAGRAGLAAAELAAARTSLAHLDAGAREADERTREAFAALSERALQANAETVVRLAREQLGAAGATAGGDLARREEAIAGLVAPLRESLARLETQNRTMETARTDAYAALREQVGAVRVAGDGLRAETSRLVAALRATGVRGRWGEVQLRRVVELAGMTEHCDFTVQQTVRTADGTLRPDLVVHLSGGRDVVVDAKVPFEAYVAADDADGPPEQRYVAHARAVREHVRRLSDKAYSRAFEPSPQFVVLFLPGEGFLAAAASADPGLVEWALGQDVVLATPTTLVALLRTVAHTWRQDALADNAAQVQKLARELYARLSTMGGHLAKVGAGLGSSVEAYNAAVGSLEGRVLVTARRMAALHDPEVSLPAPELAELRPRPLTAAELTDPADPIDPIGSVGPAGAAGPGAAGSVRVDRTA